jgi:uncharacterized repeat protein (TIGR01451 family)/LPXTG-motif cell wall-anchored protein
MKKILNILKYAPKRTIAILLIIAAVIAIPASLFAWGPDRPTFTTAVPARYVTFNSITDNPSQGDERDFMLVRDSVDSNTTYSNQANLVAGHQYTVYVYYHNNAAANLGLKSLNTYVRAEIPAIVNNGSNGVIANSYVTSSNARPNEVHDDISFNNATGGDIALRYVPGSATIHNFGATNGQALSDSIVTSGAIIGYNALDGVVPGCNQYAGYVTFNVQADQPNFTITKQVRKTGEKEWQNGETVNPDSNIDYLITYKNTGTTQQNDVVIKDTLPNGVSYTKDSTFLANSLNPSGVKVNDEIVNGGINIGNYAPNSTAYIKFSAKVASNINLLNCGQNDLNNYAEARTDNGSKSNSVKITVIKQCEVTTLPVTGASEDILSILGIGTIATSAGYYFASRKILSRK